MGLEQRKSRSRHKRSRERAHSTPSNRFAARALDDGRILMIVEQPGRSDAIATIPMLGPTCEIAFGRVAGPFIPQPGKRALDQPFFAGEVPIVLIMLPAGEAPAVDLVELEGLDGLQAVQLPDLDGSCMVAFVGFAGARPLGILAVTEPAERGWPRLHQIEALAGLAGHAQLLVTAYDDIVACAGTSSAPPVLLEAKVRMRPTVEPPVEYWPGVGTGIRLELS
ncbi:MAG: hypothetical protein CO108_01630 [Deltaproteobacteria bacterium CG_4_9_14_3_um_filter_63_12]|nr:MAG: hypothetical protein CO108_01630 [Deltaproteobacteria bacterium CG_4_9_14_3_um_filter_63_12]